MKKNTELGGTLYRLYRDAMKLEAIAIQDMDECEGLTVNELYLIECIRSFTKVGKGPAISTIASALDITRPSATVAVNKLVDKKMAVKSASDEDGRSVRVKLTRAGEKALAVHTGFQKQLAGDLNTELSEEDNAVVTKALSLLGSFLDTKIEGYTGRNRKILEREKRSKGNKKTARSTGKTTKAKSNASKKTADKAKKPASRVKKAK